MKNTFSPSYHSTNRTVRFHIQLSPITHTNKRDTQHMCIAMYILYMYTYVYNVHMIYIYVYICIYYICTSMICYICLPKIYYIYIIMYVFPICVVRNHAYIFLRKSLASNQYRNCKYQKHGVAVSPDRATHGLVKCVRLCACCSCQ